MTFFQEQLSRLADALPAIEYGRDAWLKVRAQFPDAVAKDAADHVVDCILQMRRENAKLRELLEDVLHGSVDQKLTAYEGPSLERSLRAEIRAAIQVKETAAKPPA